MCFNTSDRTSDQDIRCKDSCFSMPFVNDPLHLALFGGRPRKQFEGLVISHDDLDDPLLHFFTKFQKDIIQTRKRPVENDQNDAE
jgi:hypothetical protein